MRRSHIMSLAFAITAPCRACCGATLNGLDCVVYRSAQRGNFMTSTATPPIEIRDLEKHRHAMLKFAMLQLRNETHAEDCVQEALAAAIQSADRFAGDSSVRTWLIGILKHKILDHFRKAGREELFSAGEDETSLDDFEALFKGNGHFVDPPEQWANPEQALSQAEFFEVLERCLQ